MGLGPKRGRWVVENGGGWADWAGQGAVGAVARKDPRPSILTPSLLPHWPWGLAKSSLSSPLVVGGGRRRMLPLTME